MFDPVTIRCCAACGAVQSYKRPLCTLCRGRAFEQRALPLRGEIYSLTVVQRAPSPTFAEAVPYTVALVRGPTDGLLMMQLQDFADPPAIGEIVSIEGTEGLLVGRPA